MTTTAATMPTLPVQLSEKDRHSILENALAALQKRFYSPEKLNGDWQAAVTRHRPIIESAATADAFEQAMSDLFWRNSMRRISAFFTERPAGVEPRSAQRNVPGG